MRVCAAPKVESATAELLRDNRAVAASAPMRWGRQDRRYHGDLGKPAGGSYTLRALLVVESWNVTVAGPDVDRRISKCEAATMAVAAGR